MIKTPKNLDTPNVFDFLGFPPPSTPRSAKMYRDLSPNRILDYHPTRDHLSPRLSPRFPILDTPTDLSNRPAQPLVRVHDGGENNEAEDLSTKSKSTPTQSHPPMSPPPTPPQASFHHRHASVSPQHPIKLEYRSVKNRRALDIDPNSKEKRTRRTVIRCQFQSFAIGSHYIPFLASFRLLLFTRIAID